LRILICHNYYARRSGECAVVDQEAALLREKGHDVEQFSYDNADFLGFRFSERTKAGFRAIYSTRTDRDIRRFLLGKTFDVAHVHNTWGVMSPSIYKALWLESLPVVKTVHNFRWLCPVGTFYRDGRLCHDCVEKPGGVIHGVVHRCYQGNLAGSMMASTRLFVNRDLLRIFDRYIDIIVVQNTFVRDRLIQNGFPAEKMALKGNFLRRREFEPTRGDHAIFLGRLEASKGLRTLLDAMEGTTIPLRIFGQGPLEPWLRDQVARRFGPAGRVSYEGYASRPVLMQALASSRAVVFPSEWYESYPIAIVEAMAHGKPVIASDLGSIPSIVEHEVNGLLFKPGDPQALATQIDRLWSDDSLQERLEAGAKAAYEAKMAPEANYRTLMQIYEAAIESRKTRSPGRRD